MRTRVLHGHSKADLRNWHLHRVALEKLHRHPELMSAVLSLLDGWLRDEKLRASYSYLQQWRELLTTSPFEEMRALLLDTERGQALRQCSPLGPLLTPQERWQAFQEAGEPATPAASPALA